MQSYLWNPRQLNSQKEESVGDVGHTSTGFGSLMYFVITMVNIYLNFNKNIKYSHHILIFEVT